MTKDKVYFTGLNGIRFWAAFSVIFHHIEQTKFWVGMPSLWNTTVVDNIGHKGRIIFFVLSGFLITYLFLAEMNKTGTLNLKKFHIRRNLRVWPLYFVIVAFAFFVLPHIIDLVYKDGRHYNNMLEFNFGKKIVVFGLFLPNIARILWQPPILGVSQLWSIGVQEQFYMVWPALTRIFKKVFVQFIIVFIAVKVITEFGLKYWYEHYQTLNIHFASFNQVKTLIRLWELFAVEQLAIGALAAYIFFHQKMKILNFIYHPVTYIIIVGLYVYLFFIRVDFFAHVLVEGIIAAFLMLNISTNPTFFIKLENRFYNYLGNISYGIYMFHTIVIVVVLYYLQQMNLTSNSILFNILIYSFTIAITLGLSALSYKYFENYFLRLKSKFEVVKSYRKSGLVPNDGPDE